MFSGACLGSISEGRKNGSAFVPIRKLIGVVAAPRLAGLSRGDQQNRFVPIAEIGDEAHRRSVVLGGRAHAVSRAGLRLVGDAQQFLQQAFPPDGMEHVQ